jgi:hypothetical protein
VSRALASLAAVAALESFVFPMILPALYRPDLTFYALPLVAGKVWAVGIWRLAVTHRRLAAMVGLSTLPFLLWIPGWWLVTTALSFVTVQIPVKFRAPAPMLHRKRPPLLISTGG